MKTMPACLLIGLVLLAVPLASAAAEPIRVTGRILDGERRSGLASARVELFPAYEEHSESVRRLTEKAEPVPLASVRTRAHGSFEIAAPESGGFRVRVQAEGYLPMEYPLLLLVEDTEMPETTLVPGQPLEAQTVGTQGQPLAGIEVQLTFPQAWWGSEREDDLPGWKLADPKGVSGRDGRLTLPSVSVESLALTATSPEFLGQGVSSAPGSPATLRLSALQTVSIEVQDAGGKPVAGALVHWRGLAVAAAGPDGRCSLTVPEKEPPLVKTREGWWARIARPPGNTAAGVVLIRLQPPRRIAGKVIDQASGRPVAGALVWSGWPLLAPVARTNAEGAFQIAVPADEDIWLQAAAAGFLRDVRRAVEPRAGESTVIKLTPAVGLSGIVVDAADQPVADVQIVATPSSFDSMRLEWPTARSRADGGFRLTGLHPGIVYKLIATREGFSRTKLAARTAPAGHPSAPVRIVMEEGKTAFGRVVNEAGQPIVGAEVTMTGDRHLTAMSGEDGRFEFRHLDFGTRHLLARGRGYSYAVLSNIEIPAGETVFDLGVVTLPAGAAIEGRVTDSRGLKIEGAGIIVWQSGIDSGIEEFLISDLLGSTQTGPDGGFRVEGLRRGERYDLTLAHPGFVDASAPGVEAPTGEPIRIEMKAARSLKGRVVGPASEPVPGASLSWIQELRFDSSLNRSDRSLGTTDPEGRFQVSGLPAGSVDIEVAAEGYETRQIEGLQIPEGKDLESLEITLRRGAVLEVQVLDAQGEPVRGVAVNAEPEKPLTLANLRFWNPGYAQTDYRGRCRLVVTGQEAYRVTASTGVQSATTRLVPGPGSTPVELRLTAGFELSGRVLGGNNEAVQEVSVHLEDLKQRGVSVPVAADGTFVFSDIPDGEYHLKAQNSLGKMSAPLEVKVASRPVRDLELRLDREDERATLKGHILGLSPDDLRRVSVMASPASGGHMIQGQVGPGAEYHVEGLDPGSWMVQAQTATSRVVTKTIRIEPGATTATLDLEFPHGGLTLSGRVLLDGTPLVEAAVAAGSGQSGAGWGGLAQTAWDGSFTLRDLEPGPLTLVIFNLNGISSSRTVQLTEDQEITIEFTSGRLRGTIVAASGEPVEDAAVTVAPMIQELASLPAATVRSGPDGAFESPRLISGPYRITIVKQGFAPAELTVEIPPGGESTVEIQLTALAP